MLTKIRLKYEESAKVHLLLDVLLMLLLAVIAVIPAFTGHYYNASSDAFYHLDRFENIYQALKSGHLPSLFNFAYSPSNSRVGVAINAIYPWIPGLVFVLPRFLIADPIVALAVGFVILNLLTMLSARVLMKTLTKHDWLIWFGIILYQFNNFHFVDLYTRSAFGESFAYAWLPLVVAGVIQINEKRPSGKYWLGLGMGMIINSHVLTLLFALGFVALYEIIICFTKQLSLQKLWALLQAAGLALLVGLYSIVNLVSLYANAKFVEPDRYLFVVDPWSFLQAFVQNDMRDTAYWAYGLPLLLLQVVLTVAVFKSARFRQWGAWIIAGDALTIALFNWWPWDKFSNSAISLIQFFGRLNSLIVLCIIVATVLYFAQRPVKGKWKILLVEGLVCALSLSGTYHIHQQFLGSSVYHDRLEAKTYDEQLTNRYSFSDYLPVDKQTKKVDYETNSPENAQLKETKRTYNSITFNVQTNGLAAVNLPVVTYRHFNYAILVNGKVVSSQSENQPRLALAAGAYTVSVQAKSSVHPVLLIISLLSILFILVVLVYRRYRPKRLS